MLRGWHLAKDSIHHLSSLGQRSRRHNVININIKNLPSLTSALLSWSPWWHLSPQTWINIRNTGTMPTWADSQTAFTNICLSYLLARYPRYPWYHWWIRAAHEKTFTHTNSWWYWSYPQHLSLGQQLMIIQRLGVSTFSCRNINLVMWQPGSLFSSWSEYMIVTIILAILSSHEDTC